MRYPKLHSSIVGGAGYLSPLAGSLLDILDLVLVQGYEQGEDTAQPLGWTAPFDRYLNRRVYRPGAGLQQLFRVSDDVAAAGFKVATVEGYESMPDIDTGFGYWGVSRLGKCSGSSPLNVPQYSPAWWILGDAKGFYLLIGDHEVNPVSDTRGIPVVLHYLGDFDSLVVGDTYNSMILGHTNSSLLPTGVTESFFKQWGSPGAVSNGICYSEAIGGSLGVSLGMVQPEGGRAFAASQSTPTLDPAHMVIGDAIPRLSSLLLTGVNGIRGKLPGLYSVWPQIAGRTGDTFLNSTGDSFMLVNMETSAGYWEQFALQLNVW